MSNQYLGDDRIVHESIDVPKASSRRIYSNSEAPDDIVTRLRERAIVLFSNGADGNAFIDEQAADEIERLRAEVVRTFDHAANEIERLRADRDRWRDLADSLARFGNCESSDCPTCNHNWKLTYQDYEQAVRGEG